MSDVINFKADSQPRRFTNFSKFLVGILLCGFAISYFNPDGLELVPFRIVPNIWTLVTSGFYVTDLVELAVDIPLVLLACRCVEPVYGSRVTAGLLLATAPITALAFTATTFVHFAVEVARQRGQGAAKGEDYDTVPGEEGVSTFLPQAAALLVAVKHVMPEASLLGTRVKAKYLPLIFLTTILVGEWAFTKLLGGDLTFGALSTLLMASYGTLSTWVYLRYIQKQPGSDTKGDKSEDMALTKFFPPVISATSGLIKGLRGGDAKSGLPDQAPSLPISTPTPGGGWGKPHPGVVDTSDVARRRERGAKALEERLGKKMHSSQ